MHPMETDIKFKIKEINWVLALQSMTEIQVSKKEESTLKLLIDPNINSKISKEKITKISFNKKKIVEIMFNFPNEMNLFIFHCRRLFFGLTKKYINVTVN